MIKQTVSWMLAGLLWHTGCDARSIGGAAGDPECSVTSYELDVRFIEMELVDLSPMPLAAEGARVYYTTGGTLGTNTPEDPEIFALDTHSEAVSQITADNRHTVLLDAADGAVLYREADYLWAEPSRLKLRTASGPVVDLGDYLMYTTDYGRGWYTPSPRRLLDSGRAAWAADGRVYLYDGITVTTVFDGGGSSATWPYLRDGVLVFAAWDDNDTEIYRYADGELRRLTDNASQDDLPVASGGRVFWVCDDGICVWDEEDPQARVLDEGSCFEPDTDQGKAAWVCDGQVRLFDGDTVRSLTGDGVAADGVRLRDGKLVWIAVTPEEPPNIPLGLGTLMFSDGRDAWEVATVGLPCIYCGAYWPPLYLSFTGELIAWTYATTGDPPQPFGPDLAAYTKVVGVQSCE